VGEFAVKGGKRWWRWDLVEANVSSGAASGSVLSELTNFKRTLSRQEGGRRGVQSKGRDQTVEHLQGIPL